MFLPDSIQKVIATLGLPLKGSLHQYTGFTWHPVDSSLATRKVHGSNPVTTFNNEFLTGVPDDNDDPGCDVIGAQDGDPVVVGVGDGELSLADVKQRDWTDNLK